MQMAFVTSQTLIEIKKKLRKISTLILNVLLKYIIYFNKEIVHNSRGILERSGSHMEVHYPCPTTFTGYPGV